MWLRIIPTLRSLVQDKFIEALESHGPTTKRDETLDDCHGVMPPVVGTNARLPKDHS